jgi:hypothetical protein
MIGPRIRRQDVSDRAYTRETIDRLRHSHNSFYSRFITRMIAPMKQPGVVSSPPLLAELRLLTLTTVPNFVPRPYPD